MVDEKSRDPETRIAQGRSPAYPYFDLAKAIEKVEEVRVAGAARTTLPPETFYKIWDIGAQSSGARQTMAALNQFGLVEYIGRGDDRKVKLSDLALKIVHDKEPSSQARAVAIKEAAVTPSIHAELYEKYGVFLPADVVLETYLVRDRGYNEGAAQSLVAEYKATLAFSGLDKPDSMLGTTETQRNAVRKDHDWSKAAEAIGKTPPGMRHEFDQPEGAPPTGMRRAVFNVAEGDVTLVFPEGMSKDSVSDLEGYLKIWFGKAKRDSERGGSSGDTAD